jgi:cbb3-type cytochrome oxidase subunit 3
VSPTEISLLAVTAGFVGLVVWVYRPSRRQHFESLGSIPLDDDTGTGPDAGPEKGPQMDPGRQTNKDKEL